MRVLFHVGALRMGGAERQLVTLVRGLVERGVEPHVVTFYPGGQYWNALAKWGGCPLTSLNRRGRFDFAVIFKLARYCRENDIDLIQGWMPPANTFAALAGHLASVPVSMGIRSSNMTCPHLGGRLYLLSDGILGSVFADAILCNSHAGVRSHERLLYPSHKMGVIPNGVQFPTGTEFPPPFAHEPPWRIGVPARFAAKKDHPNLLRATRMLLDAGEDVHLYLFGDGPEVLRRQLEALTAELRLDGSVTWHGHVQDIWANLAEMDILVSSSAFGEGTSNAILEGLAAGRVVVATDVGDAARLINGDDGGSECCGYLVPPRAPRELAAASRQAIRDFYGRPTDTEAYQKRARERVDTRYSSTDMVERYVEVYKRLLARSVAAPDRN